MKEHFKIHVQKLMDILENDIKELATDTKNYNELLIKYRIDFCNAKTAKEIYNIIKKIQLELAIGSTDFNNRMDSINKQLDNLIANETGD